MNDNEQPPRWTHIRENLLTFQHWGQMVSRNGNLCPFLTPSHMRKTLFCPSLHGPLQLQSRTIPHLLGTCVAPCQHNLDSFSTCFHRMWKNFLRLRDGQSREQILLSFSTSYSMVTLNTFSLMHTCIHKCLCSRVCDWFKHFVNNSFDALTEQSCL